MAFERILRCADGHLFVEGIGARMFLSLHLGSARLLRCPVDRRWRMARFVSPNDLSEQEIEQARANG
ncbi:hypothetical protein GCM10023322_74300 [Rugosimonospora acidiphila]|uniref:Uncharacterized protein n=1 Tax=Rugosimonospora acidiphila TaxID=556531 RepID=A0ABP9SQ68_9ACTN